ncbi:MAG: dynamin family protein [Acidimicrobiales bacterium]
MNTPQKSTKRKRAEEIVEAAKGAASRLERADLLARLETTSARLAEPEVTVLVIGEFKQGKSSLVNALIKAPVCPVDDDVATAVATVIGYADHSRASISCEPLDDSGEEQHYEIKVADAGGFVVSGRIAGTNQKVNTVEVRIPRKILRAGLRVVDTPGVGGLESAHGKATMGALSMTDAVIFVTDSSQELTASELEFLKTAHQRCPNVICAMSKIDIYPRWSKIMELNQGHLADAGLEIEIFPIASPLRTRALELNDAALHDESGFPALMERIEQEILSSAEAIHVGMAMKDVRAVADQLLETETTKREAIADPATREALLARAHEARDRAEGMKLAATRWQVVLNDGFADLTSNTDHDLKQRTRALIAEVEDLIDENDPAKIGDELFPMVEERLMADIAENYYLLRQDAVDLSKRVLEVFEIDSNLADIQVASPSDLLEDRQRLDVELSEAPSYAQSLLTGMRGSYGGMLMFGMLGGLVGLATFGPVTLAIGGFMGRKAAKEERQRQLTLRRQQAKIGIKKYIDEVVFSVSKHSRDTLRQIQRDLRDSNLERAKELSTTAAESMKAAQVALKTDEAERNAEVKTLDASIDQLQRILKASVEVMDQ